MLIVEDISLYKINVPSLRHTGARFRPYLLVVLSCSYVNPATSFEQKPVRVALHKT